MRLARRRLIATTRDFTAVADDAIEQNLEATGQLMNVGGPEEFAKSIDEQRNAMAGFAKELDIPPLPQN